MSPEGLAGSDGDSGVQDEPAGSEAPDPSADGVAAAPSPLSAMPIAKKGAQLPGGMSLQAVSPVVKTHTYVFHAGGEAFATVILKGEEVLERPADPTIAGKRFDGWYTDEACTQPFDGFGEPAAALDDGTTDLWAKFSDVHYFTYHDEHGKVIETEIVELGQEYTFHAQWPAFTLDSDTARNDGWEDQYGNRYADLDKYPDGQKVKVLRDLDLYPVPQEGFYVHFHGQGGSATVSQFVHEGGKVTEPNPAPTRQGYSFAGWYDAPEGGYKFDFSASQPVPASGSLELYAQWKPAEAKYCVVYWLENADDDGFSRDEVLVRSGTTGSPAEFETREYKSMGANRYGNSYYVLDEAKNGPALTTAADGSTVYNVYYRRARWNVVVQDRDGNVVGEAIVKWGQDSAVSLFTGAIGSYYESVGSTNTFTWYYGTTRWYGWANSKVFPSPRIPEPYYPDGSTLVLKPGNEISNKTWSLHVMEQTIPGLERPDLESSYIESRTVGGVSGAADLSALPVPSVGFTFSRVADLTTSSNSASGYALLNESSAKWKDGYVFYTRNRYALSFSDDVAKNAGVPFGYDQIPFEQSMACYAPQGFPASKTVDGVRYLFVGWFDNPAYVGDPFDFNSTMPAHDLMLYAKWIPETHTVTFDPNGGTMQDADKRLTVPYGMRLEEPAEPTYHGHRFVDWHVVDPGKPGDMGTPFVFGSPVTEDLVLRAHWTSDVSHTIIYKPGEGSGAVPSIGSYRSGSTGKAQAGDALVPPAGKHFVYWRAADGGVYYPGDLVPVGDSNVVLTAVYEPADLVGLTYDLNYAHHGIASPCGYETSAGPAGLLVNSTVRLRAPTAAEVPAGWEFAGWYLDAACTGEPVEAVLVDALAPGGGLSVQAAAGSAHNVVYAKWVKKAAPAPDPEGDDGKQDKPPASEGKAKQPAAKAVQRAAPGAMAKTGDGLLPIAALCTIAALASAGVVAAAVRRRNR